MTRQRAFLDFYRKHKISPVAQDISDIRRHLSRRDYLYRNLGLPPSAFHDRSIIELGPGSGHNALYPCSLGPRRYVLVDGNETGIEHARKLLSESLPNLSGLEFALADILEYRTSERFDIVICEGVIPHQQDPWAFCRHVAALARPGGVVAITTADPISMFAETLRRAICNCLIAPDMTVDEKQRRLHPLVVDHLSTLPGRSRPVDDWILDNVLNPWTGSLFGIADAIQALSDGFEIYGSSPRFLSDWRWYKDVFDGQQKLNQRAVEQYRKLRTSLLDWRSAEIVVDNGLSSFISDRAARAFRAVVAYESTFDRKALGEVGSAAMDVGRSVAALLPAASGGYLEAGEFILAHQDALPVPSAPGFPFFRACFGRSQQYVSFVRHKGWSIE